jgi:hypothetical protein
LNVEREHRRVEDARIAEAKFSQVQRLFWLRKRKAFRAWHVAFEQQRRLQTLKAAVNSWREFVEDEKASKFLTQMDTYS